MFGRIARGYLRRYEVSTLSDLLKSYVCIRRNYQMAELAYRKYNLFPISRSSQLCLQTLHFYAGNSHGRCTDPYVTYPHTFNATSSRTLPTRVFPQQHQGCLHKVEEDHL
jgi:hypothetical protein